MSTLSSGSKPTKSRHQRTQFFDKKLQKSWWSINLKQQQKKNSADRKIFLDASHIVHWKRVKLFIFRGKLGSLYSEKQLSMSSTRTAVVCLYTYISNRWVTLQKSNALIHNWFQVPSYQLGFPRTSSTDNRKIQSTWKVRMYLIALIKSIINDPSIKTWATTWFFFTWTR